MNRFKQSVRNAAMALPMAVLPVALTALASAAMPAGLRAQAPTVRSMTGTVSDKAGAKVKGAVVHLKDTRSLAQRSYITAEDGVFRFGQLSTSTEYEVWADFNGQKTASKSISSFDTKKEIDVALKVQ